MNRHVIVTAVIFLIFAVVLVLAILRGDLVQSVLFGVGTVAFLIRLLTMTRTAPKTEQPPRQ